MSQDEAMQRLLYAALISYLKDAATWAAKKKGCDIGYHCEQAYDDLMGNQVMLKHLCRHLPISPDYVARKFKRSLVSGSVSFSAKQFRSE